MCRQPLLLPLIFCFPAWLLSSASHSEILAAEIHVASNGSDANIGTSDLPVRSLQQAQLVARSKIAAGLTEDLHVVIHAGDYRLRQPLLFTPADSSEKHRVVWRAHEKETPVIHGALAINNWHENRDKSWSATIDDWPEKEPLFRELFVNSKRRTRARHPNQGYLRIKQAAPDKRSGFLFHADDIPLNANSPGMELVFFHDWSTSRISVRGIDRKKFSLVAQNPIGCAADHYQIDHFEPNPRYYLENDPAFLDAPGEWFLDRESMTVRYIPAADEDFSSARVMVPLASTLLEVRGTVAAPVRNLHFSGIRFSYCKWHPPTAGYAGGQAAIHELQSDQTRTNKRGFVPAAVTVEIAEDCSFKNCRFENLGGTGLLIGQRCQRNRVEGNRFHDISANGLMIGEDLSRKHDNKPWWRDFPEQTATKNVIRNNTIQNVGQQFYGAVGIWAGITRETEISHNEIRNLPYTGISIGWVWNPMPTTARDNLIANNHIHHVMQVLSDGAGVYSLGSQPGTVLRGNHVHDVPLNLGRAESNGFFLDQGSANFLIEQNVFYRIGKSPIRFHQAGKNTVQENIMACGKGLPGIRYNRTEEGDILQQNNVVYQGNFPNDAAKPIIENAGLTGSD